MGFEKILKGLGRSELEIEGEKVLVLAKTGEFVEYQDEIANLEEKFTDEKGNLIAGKQSKYLLATHRINVKYAKKFILNANPQFEESDIDKFLEMKGDYVYDVLDAVGLINKDKLKAKEEAIEKEEIKN